MVYSASAERMVLAHVHFARPVHCHLSCRKYSHSAATSKTHATRQAGTQQQAAQPVTKVTEVIDSTERSYELTAEGSWQLQAAGESKPAQRWKDRLQGVTADCPDWMFVRLRISVHACHWCRVSL